MPSLARARCSRTPMILLCLALCVCAVAPGTAGAAARDRDGDGLSDRYERTRSHTSVTHWDTDRDGLSDRYEHRRSKTNPRRRDTDRDLLTDREELYPGAPPSRRSRVRQAGRRPKTDPLKRDTDRDGLSDGYEVRTSLTDPTRADTDGEGLKDGQEVNTTRTDPLKRDTDGDGLTDAAEIRRGTDPRDAASPAPAAAPAPAPAPQPAPAPPSTTPPSDPLTLAGSRTVQPTADWAPSGLAEAFRTRASATGTASSAGLYVDAGSSATSVAVAVYSDASGHPGQRLAGGTIATPRAASWNTVGISPPVALEAGTTYWLAVLGTGGTLRFRDDSSGSCAESPSGSGLSALPANWSPGTTWANCNLSAYVAAGALDPPPTDPPPVAPPPTDPPPVNPPPVDPPPVNPPPTDPPPVDPPSAAARFVATSGSDSNGCTAAAPCQTFNRAYRAASPGDTVEVAAGAYPEQTLTADTSKTGPASVTFRPAAGATVAVAKIYVGGASFVAFTGIDFGSRITVENTNPGSAGSRNVTFQNARAKTVRLVGRISNIALLGGQFGNTVDNQPQIKKYNPGDPENSRPFGVTIDGASFLDFRRSGSSIHTECLQILHADTVTVRNSRFNNCDGTGAIGITDGPSDNLTIENNWFGPGGDAYFNAQITKSTRNLALRFNSSAKAMIFSDTEAGGPYLVAGNYMPRNASFCTSGATYVGNVLAGGTCGASDRAVSSMRFVDTANFDLHLRADSEAIDAVPPSAGHPARDIDGDLRPLGGLADAGADELR